MIKTLLLVACAAACGSVSAQSDYPNKPVRMVVGFAAGGISDVLGRAVAITLSKQLGQQVIVENKPGAGTTIAGDFIVRSPPDGYNIWLQDITTHAINTALYSKLPYDSIRDFTYIAMIASTPLMLVVHPTTPAHNVRELIELLKSNPGKYSYGSSGNGTIVHLSAEMLKHAAGVDVLHVPYKGSNPATQAILGGEVTFVFSTMPPAVSNARAGKLRALAVTTSKRVPAAPEVPTMIEAGLKDFDIVLYSGILGPKGMDRAVVRRLNAAFAVSVRSPEMQKVYEQLGADAIVMTPEEFEAATAREIAKLAPIVKASGAKLD
ncbi:MAG TPA: tripartite tricarboxylate transporter substrate binding protein [Burkholderiales bacterium]|nr:tripartite tricarboxylate transporter substrate binding protein [Burkholderiales bacterium]